MWTGDFTDRSHRSEDVSPAPEAATEADEDVPAVVDPTPLLPKAMHAPVQRSEPSALLSDDDCRALASAMPVRHRWRRWHLLYSSSRDGISLATLFRHVLQARHTHAAVEQAVNPVRAAGEQSAACRLSWWSGTRSGMSLAASPLRRGTMLLATLATGRPLYIRHRCVGCCSR